MSSRASDLLLTLTIRQPDPLGGDVGIAIVKRRPVHLDALGDASVEYERDGLVRVGGGIPHRQRGIFAAGGIVGERSADEGQHKPCKGKYPRHGCRHGRLSRGQRKPSPCWGIAPYNPHEKLPLAKQGMDRPISADG